MQCDKCKTNPASVHIQQFVNGQKADLHLCQDCAFKFDNPEMLVSLENIFKGFLDQLNTKYTGASIMGHPIMGATMGKPPVVRPAKACSRCKMTFHKFKSGGRLGCDMCYTSFAEEVELLLKSVQGSTRHEGKCPRRMGAGIMSKRQVVTLREQLKKAIEEENFEEAARLRDEIRALDKPPAAEKATASSVSGWMPDMPYIPSENTITHQQLKEILETDYSDIDFDEEDEEEENE